MYTKEYYSAVKNDEIIKFTGKWMELEIIILREISQTPKDKCSMFSLIYLVTLDICASSNYRDYVEGFTERDTALCGSSDCQFPSFRLYFTVMYC